MSRFADHPHQSVHPHVTVRGLFAALLSCACLFTATLGQAQPLPVAGQAKSECHQCPVMVWVEFPAHLGGGGLWVGRKLVTQREWREQMQGHGAPLLRQVPTTAPGLESPQHSVKMGEIDVFLDSLRKASGQRGYRLPTQDEWDKLAALHTGSVCKPVAASAARTGRSDGKSISAAAKPEPVLSSNPDHSAASLPPLGLQEFSGVLWQWLATAPELNQVPQAALKGQVRGGAFNMGAAAHACASLSVPLDGPELTVGLRVVRPGP